MPELALSSSEIVTPVVETAQPNSHRPNSERPTPSQPIPSRPASGPSTLSSLFTAGSQLKGVYSIHPSVTNRSKRLLDIIGALVGLLVTGLILIPIAIAIYLDDPGPIFYSQLRCGLHGKPFRIWKFRSMVSQADKLKHMVHNEAKGGIFKNRHDPRITKVGKVLRRTSLDEFPQFWNVLRGDMSLVGTRPPTVSEVLEYKRHHWQRLNVRPGITGEWQVSGRSTVLDFEEIVRMDVNYQKVWTVKYDLLLIFRTLMVVFQKHGAC